MVDVNLWAVLACGVASMVIGTFWYGPLFGKQWMALMGFTEQSIEEAKKKGMGKTYALMFVGALIQAYVLAHSIAFAQSYLGLEDMRAGVEGGLWNWLGFIAPVTLGSVLWEGKSWKLWLLNNGYYIVLLQVMGVILVTFR